MALRNLGVVPKVSEKKRHKRANMVDDLLDVGERDKLRAPAIVVQPLHGL